MTALLKIIIMPTYNTITLIDSLEAATESILNKATAEWQLTPASILNQIPATGKWSAAQCLDHLNSYGNYYLPQLQKAIQKAKQQQQQPTMNFNSGWLGNYFTNLMKPEYKGKPSKKMKAPKNHLPAEKLDAASVVATFIQQQETFLLLLREARTINLNATRVPISIASYIKLKLGDVLMFLVAHNQRHLLQAENSLKAIQKKQVAA